MRPGQSNKRSRGRGGRKGPSPLSRSYESNGPDVKIRGTAQHIADKYINLARDAQSSGDPVLSEAYFQHAEHFYRIVAAAQQQMNQPVNVKRADDPIETEEGDEENENFDPSDPDSPQPQMNGNGSGNGRDNDRRSFDDDGERRPRRNRGRSRRGRDDERSDGRQEGRSEGRSENRSENRSDNRSGNGEARAEGSRDASSESAPQPGDDQPRSAETDAPAQTPDVKPVEATQAETVSSEAAPEVAASDAGEDKPVRARRAPRARKASVEVADRSEGGDAPAAPKPVSLGDDVAPVQVVPDES